MIQVRARRARAERIISIPTGDSIEIVVAIMTGKTIMSDARDEVVVGESR